MSLETLSPAIEPDHYRAVMRHFPTGVAAICSTDPVTGKPCGLIVGTFQALSMEPALVTFSVTRTSTSWPKISRSGSFSVSLLADGQQGVCKALSGKAEDKFAAIGWEESPRGNPRIDGSLGWIDCTVHQELDGGDHVLVVASVQEMRAADGEPLVFHGGRLGGFRESTAA
ncbi:flavin reductase family protein [Arthrobacter ginkgonis]|uniref:Flavin reductase family protein n=1 Tax=Arthrobacter ginkgonis TaxID=1630594 RepID=A0ABP7C0D7_9MICC